MPPSLSRRVALSLLVAAALAVPLTVGGQAQDSPPGPELASILNFETDHSGGVPRGWTGGPPGTIAVDGEHVHSGRWAVRLDRPGAATGGQTSTSLIGTIPVDFGGKTIEWRGYLRSENVSGFMG